MPLTDVELDTLFERLEEGIRTQNDELAGEATLAIVRETVSTLRGMGDAVRELRRALEARAVDKQTSAEAGV